jgi:hypothetical protein
VTLHYDQRLAAAELVPPPGSDELEAAHSELLAALRAAGLSAETPKDADPKQPGWGAAVATARNLLLAEGWVFPPPAPAPGGAGLVLAKVRSRRTGLTRRLWGETVRYRRVRHATPLLQGFAVHASLRLAKGPLAPVARWSGYTVFLDADAVARRAGQGPFVGFSPADLARNLELQQVATLHVSRQVGLEEFAKGGAPSVVRLALARVWLTLLVEGDLALTERRLRAEGKGRSSWAQAAAFVLSRCPLSGSAQEVRDRALRVYQALIDGALVVPEGGRSSRRAR